MSKSQGDITSFFAGVAGDDELIEPQRLLLDESLRNDLIALFERQADDFLDDNMERIEFDPKAAYRIDSHQIYVIRPFKLPDEYVRAIQKPHTLTDFQLSERLGPGDHLVEWSRPDRPEWMDEATYAWMPATLKVREMEYAVNKKGFRADVIVIVTTLLDADVYTRDDLADLYRQRWSVELDIRAIKCSLDIDVLRCKSPEMVRKEIWMGLLAYNLIRKTLLRSALASGQSPRVLSFAAALETIAAGWISTLLLSATAFEVLIATHHKHLAKHRVGNRPDRVEPRAVKRRPKMLALLTKPRAEAREELLTGKA